MKTLGSPNHLTRPVLAISLIAALVVQLLPIVGYASEQHSTDAARDYFVDDNDSVHEGYLNALAASGLIVGCNPPENDHVCPDRPVTRGEFATVLARALGMTSRSDTGQFEDLDTSVHRSSIEVLARRGVIRGCNPPANSQFCPGSPVTRGAMAAFLHRALGG